MKQTECCADGFNEPVFLPGTIQIYRPLHFIRATHQRQNPVEDGQQRKRDDKPLRLEDAEQAEQRKEETLANPPSSAAVSASAWKYLIKYTGYGKNNAEGDNDARCEAHGIDQQKNAHKPSNMQDTTFTYALISLKNDVCLQNKCIGSRIVERIPHKLLQHKGCRTFFEISALDLLVTAPLPAP